jgi:hypothetical protein
MAREKTSPWHSFTISGTTHKVRMVRQYDGQRGTVWRDYQNERGHAVCIQARGPGGRRSAPEKATARTAASRFAGNP